MPCTGKKIVGIGGNIGSGKTTCARFFRECGARCISADRIGWSVIPHIASSLVRKFGRRILTGNRIDRKKMRRIVFSSEKNLAFLNRLSHPPLVKKIIAAIDRSQSGMVVIDAALLFDWKNLLKKTDYTVLVQSPIAKKEHRSIARGIDKSIFWYIIKQQKKERVMAKTADFIITNDRSLRDLKKQCRAVYREISCGC